MKICYLSNGSSIHIKEWIKYFRNKGYEISLISDQPSEIDGISTHIIDKYESKFHIPILSSLYQIIKKKQAIKTILKNIKPDILHSHYANIYGFLASLTNFHPHILTCHGSDLLVHPKRSFVEKMFVKFALRNADFITLPSKEMKEIAISFGANIKNIQQIQYGIFPEAFQLKKRETETINILSTRNLTPLYKTELIIKAVTIIIKKYPNVHLNIVGDGSDRGKLETLVEQNKIKEKVTFFGYMKHSEISKIYENSEIYVTACPTDGLSISLLEALASGLLPVLSNNKSNGSLIEYKFDLLLFELNNVDSLVVKLEKAIETIENQGFNATKNRQLLEKYFDRNKNLKKIETLYKQINS